MDRRLSRAILALCLLAVLPACAQTRKEPPKRYPVQGQVLAVNAARREITLKHGDIPGFMPAMIMTYPAADARLMDGRTAGELVSAILEVSDSIGTLVDITHTGTAPLPSDSNSVQLAAGVLDVGDAAPDAAFIDQANRRRSFSEWRGKPTVVSFIYTSCPLPDYCPLTEQNFATLQRRLRDDTILRNHVQLVTFTFDPARDTPAVLAAHAARFKLDPNVWTYLTGDAVTVQTFAAKFGISTIQDPTGTAEITHNLRTFLIGADGRIVKIYSGNDWTPGAVLTDLRALVSPSK
jgi:protein SCO1